MGVFKDQSLDPSQKQGPAEAAPQRGSVKNMPPILCSSSLPKAGTTFPPLECGPDSATPFEAPA